MRITLVGADLEENLGLGMIAALLRAAGHGVDVVAFNETAQLAETVRRVKAKRPRLIGLGIQFQHRSHDFLSLARKLRETGYRGHITCGGQFSTMAYAEILRNDPAVDSVVLHEGEQAAVELAEALASGGSLYDIRGLALRSPDSAPMRTASRELISDLDRLPFPIRYREHTRHLGVPFIPISGGRGCWGSCAFCSISTFYRDARAYGGGKNFRLRSPENIAAEMAVLSSRVAGPAIFCFHDDTFLLPRPADSLKRVTALRSCLDELGVGKVGLIGKCRPECLTAELAGHLRRLGVIRLYVGVENASQRGQDHLNRKTRSEQVKGAIAALNQAGIFGCYNLLLFEPDATLDDVRENIAFMREHAANPVNFCRAEAYHGTPLYLRLQREDRLNGSYLGWDYRIRDHRTELLFRICSAAFRERNFHPRGVANRYMGLGYMAKILEDFYDGSTARARGLMLRAKQLTVDVSQETAEFLEQALEMAASADLGDRDLIERETARLGLRIAAHDRIWHSVFDELLDDMRAYVGDQPSQSTQLIPNLKLREAVQRLAVAGCLTLSAAGCFSTTENPNPPNDASADGQIPDGQAEGQAGDARADVRYDGMVVDPLPADAAWYDPLPPDAGMKDGSVKDSSVKDSSVKDTGWADPAPKDAGWYDPLPVDAAWYDPLPPDAGAKFGGQAMLLDHWRDTAPRRTVRSEDLPLFDPPAIALSARPEGDFIEVCLRGGPAAISVRWETEGSCEGAEREVRWRPRSDADQLRVAVRSKGGIAIATLRAADLPGWKAV